MYRRNPLPSLFDFPPPRAHLHLSTHIHTCTVGVRMYNARVSSEARELDFHIKRILGRNRVFELYRLLILNNSYLFVKKLMCNQKRMKMLTN